MTDRGYVGRFAPSPTGPLHFGSLVAAVGSYLDARRNGGLWRLRLEDVDEPRCSRQAADGILRTLEAFGFEWDGEVVVQSKRKDRYREVLEVLKREGRVYPCGCTRKELADSTLAPDGAAVYPGTCRNGLPPGREARAWRLRVDDSTVCFDDAVQGRYCRQLAREIGDFVLLRADGYFAYQLAVVVDDADQGITHVVRGADLIDSTPRQIFLQRSLGVTLPQYAHLPVAVNEAGEKLSKQTLAEAVSDREPLPVLIAAMTFLGQEVPEDVRRSRATTADFWEWAKSVWRLDRVPGQRALLAVLCAPVAGNADSRAYRSVGEPGGGPRQ